MSDTSYLPTTQELPSPAPELGRPEEVLPARDHVLVFATRLFSPSLVSWLTGNDKSISPFLTVLFLLLLGRAAPLRPQLGKPPCPKQSSSTPRSLLGSLNWHLPRTPVSAKPSHSSPCTPGAFTKFMLEEQSPTLGCHSTGQPTYPGPHTSTTKLGVLQVRKK